MTYRRTTQPLAPARAPRPVSAYDPYPTVDLTPNAVQIGFDALAGRLARHDAIALDGMPGVLWDDLRDRLDVALLALGKRAEWLDARRAFKKPRDLDALVRPYLGGNDPLFGTRCPLVLADFFEETADLGSPHADLRVVYGPGAALLAPTAALVYVELPKNEVQFRARAGIPTNLGRMDAAPPKEAYKRSYFVDWPVLARHKRDVLHRVEVFVDAQRPDEPTFADAADVRDALHALARRPFRARPWFEPGPWGGQWIKRLLPNLAPDAPNLAWSFELIAPENGLLLAGGGLLELAFEWLMLHAGNDVLGEAFARFGTAFPIRFDWLDTVEGGNLSLQVHPTPEYLRAHFGETFTQDETYYILHADEGAHVYLGFQEGVDPHAFRRDLEHSLATGEAVNVEQYVQRHPAHTGDLFLIPNGTVHCSGTGSLVLEISATPYIFTFKLYDWLRLDLDGNPRPLNITRAFDNLDFERQGERAARELLSVPVVLESGDGWERWQLPTHPEHFYDVHRVHLSGTAHLSTDDRCHVLAVVSGTSVRVQVNGAPDATYRFAETFVVPAAARSYRLTSENGPATVVLAFVKPGRGGA
ncbi:class I mannose-6-phosphate isomerase [Deinococcus yavapaiensis]|uniref:Mannose-6-phosphate isomerase class I n=1 Tax=Deinococcus yavapaiensis KR-236 TaxID=694435 RepID=A0A318SDY4_9DEIO|nr:class I mannose-6-phosphate isomerase [Deinococcus yavapaiensis]PYE50968.1 mannose-6-phosphate isomerase class I [Deinococcus yavapaiensis KR-236]